jgi:hypothetical protein
MTPDAQQAGSRSRNKAYDRIFALAEKTQAFFRAWSSLLDCRLRL